MNIQKVAFLNPYKEKLVGRLELPLNQKPHNFAIFAHCFTCNKNLSAVKNISRELTANGFGVLRFDFTGLGESDGDFENTNFSGNVDDLISAADFLAKNYAAPTVLVGHSLGGTAAIFAASKIDSIKAVATIGAPSNPKHVQNLLHSNLDEIKANGIAKVNLGGREFTIKKQFLDDLEMQSIPNLAKNLEKALLIMHSPQDTTVEIKNAESIYVAAKHPKSFVSIDGADHLLMKKEDSIYVGNVISNWAKRYINIPTTERLKTKHQVIASLDTSDGFSTQMKVGNHYMMADEPTSYGGNDFGPSPYELVSAGLSACTAMTIQMYAKRKNWHIENVEVHTSYEKTHALDCNDCDNTSSKIDVFNREIKFTGALEEKQVKRLLQIADKCPVHKTLHAAVKVLTKTV
jgi:putative redox protein